MSSFLSHVINVALPAGHPSWEKLYHRTLLDITWKLFKQMFYGIPALALDMEYVLGRSVYKGKLMNLILILLDSGSREIICALILSKNIYHMPFVYS